MFRICPAIQILIDNGFQMVTVRESASDCFDEENVYFFFKKF